MTRIQIKLNPQKWKSAAHWLKHHKTTMLRAMRAGMSVLHAGIHKNLSGPSHTRFPGNGNPYPGVLTGRMRNSINTQIRVGNDYLVGRVGPNVKYAVAHEFGLGHVPKRSFLVPAWKKHKKKVIDNFNRHIADALAIRKV